MNHQSNDLLDRLPVAIAIREGRKIVYANPACLALFRCSPAGAQSLQQLAEIEPSVSEAGCAASAKPVRVSLIQSGGGSFVAELRASAVDWNGRDAVQLCITDVTREEQAVVTLNNIAAGSLEGILVHRDMKPLFVNDAYVKMYGYDSRDQVLGLKSILEFTAPEDREKVLGYYKARMQGQDVPRRYTHAATTRDGRHIVVDNLVTVVDWNGEPAVQVTNVDVTDYVSAQQVGQRTRLDILGEIASGMARRFNENVESLARDLAIARTNAYLLGDGPLVATVERGATYVRHMRRDLDKLLLMSRQGDQVFGPVDLNEVVSETLQFWLAPMAPRSSPFGKITFSVQQQQPMPAVTGDRMQLQQALQSAIENAVEAMPDGGPVTVTTRTDGQRRGKNKGRANRFAVVEVTDEGPGIDPSIRKSLGRPFVTTKQGHTGFGVFTLNLILEQHGGQVEFDELPGGGTRTSLKIPVLK